MDERVVSVVRTGDSTAEEVSHAVREAVKLAGGLGERIKPGALVLLKPNVLAPPPSLHCGATTNPVVTRALADLVIEMGARAVIVESAAVGVDTEMAYAAAGYSELREAGYEILDLKKAPTARVVVEEGRVLKSLTTFEIVTQADALISIPVMKTHDQTEITLSLKNLKGLLADRDKKRLHRQGVFQGVVDAVSTLKPAFTLVDGTWCQEGLGPLYGRPVQMNLVLASNDLVAADCIAGCIMGFTPGEVLLTQFAAERGLGVADLDRIEVVGEPIARVRRRFLRSVEDRRYDVKGLRIVHAAGTCTGCRNTVISCLRDLNEAGQLSFAEGLTILTSNAEVPADCDPAALVTVGNCVPPHRRSKRFASGCPPSNVWIVQEILGNRVKVQRTYATGIEPKDTKRPSIRTS